MRGGEGIARSAVMSLSACFSWALNNGIVDDNPCFRVKKPKPRRLERFLTREEATHLLDVLTEVWERTRVRANLDDVRLHDPRHSFPSFRECLL